MKQGKRWIALLLTVVLTTAVLLTGCNTEQEQSEDETRPLMLWEVTSKEGNTLYLMGSVHVGTADMLPPAAPMTEAFQKSDALAVELDLLAYEEDMEQQLQIAYKYGMYQDGTTIQDHLSPELYQRAKEVLEEHEAYQAAYEMLTVNQWAALMQQLAMNESGYNSQYGLDRYWLQQAREQSKPIYEVESVELQMEMMESYSEALQVWILEDSLNIPAMAAALQITVNAWQQGNLELLMQSTTSTGAELPKDQQKLLDEYVEKILYNRNKGMVKKAVAYLNSGETVFFTVGAGHMGGETGLVNQLEKKGYTVKRIAANGNYYTEADGEETVSDTESLAA